MISVSLPALIFIPFLFTLAALFSGALYYAARNTALTAKTPRARIYRCTVCSHVYMDTRDVPLARCPRCACLNEAVKR